MARTQGSHSDITGPRIRKAALGLFASHGYAAVSMRQIAAEVGVQAGALYNYTSDKQSLLFDLLESHMVELLEARAASQSDLAPLAALDEFTRFHIRHHLPRSEAVFLSYMELRNLTPANFARIEALRRAYESDLEAILIAGVRAGAFCLSDTKVTTLALIAMLTGISNWYRPNGRLKTGEIEAIYVDLVRQMVGASPVLRNVAPGQDAPATAP